MVIGDETIIKRKKQTYRGTRSGGGGEWRVVTSPFHDSNLELLPSFFLIELLPCCFVLVLCTRKQQEERRL
jgi:hypothetical protein